MEDSRTQHYGSEIEIQTQLMGEALRIFSILSPIEQRSLLYSFSQITENIKVDNTTEQVVRLLTDREREVLVLLAHGYTRREIGSSLNISANTSARHIANIYRKLDISTAAEAVRIALTTGLVG